MTNAVIPKPGKIDGVIISPLKVIPDERGVIYHGVKRSEINYDIAEVYFKKLYSNVINGWHVHQSMTLSYVTIVGVTKLVLCDLRIISKTYSHLMEIYCGEGNHCRVEIPPGIANASQCVSPNYSIFANTPNYEHNPNHIYERIDPFNGKIKYEWFKKNY